MDTAALLQKCKEKYPDTADSTDPKELQELYPRIQSVSIWRPTFFLKGNNQRRGGERGGGCQSGAWSLGSVGAERMGALLALSGPGRHPGDPSGPSWNTRPAHSSGTEIKLSEPVPIRPGQ